jgi:regulator of sirC expression with transglutaminase-like and TPR domain
VITDSENAVIENSDFNNDNSHLIFNEQFDFESHSLIEIAMAIESELTGVKVANIKQELTLQHIVIKSKLSNFACSDKDKLTELINIIYNQQGFTGDWKAFFKVENALISKVIARRKGIPISMGVVLLDLLDVCGFKAQGICFPSGFMIRLPLENEVVYIDPFTGEMPTWEGLELKVRGQLGNHARLTLDMLKPDTNKTIIKRLITVIKAAYLQDDQLTLALLCSDILLRIDPEDAYEVRDRGFIFQQLDCFKLASSDFEYFIQQFPEDPIVMLLKQQINKMKIETNTQTIH